MRPSIQVYTPEGLRTVEEDVTGETKKEKIRKQYIGRQESLPKERVCARRESTLIPGPPSCIDRIAAARSDTGWGFPVSFRSHRLLASPRLPS